MNNVRGGGGKLMQRSKNDAQKNLKVAIHDNSWQNNGI
jgi:hypothetical protein